MFDFKANSNSYLNIPCANGCPCIVSSWSCIILIVTCYSDWSCCCCCILCFNLEHLSALSFLSLLRRSISVLTSFTSFLSFSFSSLKFPISIFQTSYYHFINFLFRCAFSCMPFFFQLNQSSSK